jgi:CubicO group peptidase (beta-lactamase class C family)
VVGVIVDGQPSSFGYGRLSAKDDRQPDGATEYEIGSISKVFTGILLASAVQHKEAKLDQRIQELLPADVELSIKDHPIRLWHLATHTAGLPRLPDNMSPADPNNPYADYSVDQLYEFLRTFQPNRPPEEKSDYSNLGGGLLGHLLARGADMSYEQLLQERIAQPLQMTSTAIELTPLMKQRLAPPHSADGTPSANWDIPTLAGAGAIRSTVDDMLSFLAAQLEPPEGSLGKAIDLAWQVHWRPNEAGQFSIGLGWHVAHDRQTRWHNGGTGGYHSMMLANRNLNVAVVVLCNTATQEIDRLGEDLVKLLAGVPVEPRKFPKEMEVAISADVLVRYVGRYALTPQFVLTVTRKGDELHVQATGQPAVRVFPKSETEWFYKVVDAQLTFKVNDDGKCDSLVLHQNGRDVPGRRVAD